MSKNGQAKFIRKIFDQSKADSARIKLLEAKLLRAESDANNRVQSAIDAVAAQHKEELAQLKAAHEEDWRQAAERYDATLVFMAELKERVTELGGKLDDSQKEVARLQQLTEIQRSTIVTLQSELDSIQPELALIESKKAELTQLLDKVRDRLKRKEREEEQAILNRKAMTGAVPARNRG